MKEKILSFLNKNFMFIVAGMVLLIVLLLIMILFNNKPKLTCEEVEKIALEKINGKVIGCELERRNYEVTVHHENYEYEFKISAKTGEVMSYESEIVK